MATENSTTAGTQVFEVSWTEVRTIRKTYLVTEIALDAGDAERRAKQSAGFSWVFLEQHLARLGWAVSVPIDRADSDDPVAVLRRLRAEYFIAGGEMTTTEACSLIDAVLAKVQS